MNTLNKIFKIVQSMVSKNRLINTVENESFHLIQSEGEPLSDITNSILFLINTEENEFLFI